MYNFDILEKIIDSIDDYYKWNFIAIQYNSDLSNKPQWYDDNIFLTVEWVWYTVRIHNIEDKTIEFDILLEHNKK